MEQRGVKGYGHGYVGLQPEPEIQCRSPNSHTAKLQDFPSVIPSNNFCYVFPLFSPLSDTKSPSKVQFGLTYTSDVATAALHSLKFPFFFFFFFKLKLGRSAVEHYTHKDF